MYQQTLAIVWAQWRTMRNHLPRAGKSSLAFTVGMSAVWYGIWAAGAAGVYALLSDPASRETLDRVLPAGLFLAFLYLQLIPILMVSTGSSLDMKRLLVYPIPHRQLFTIEVILRLSMAIEMMILLTGAGLGLLRNPALPYWSPLALLPFILFNLLLSAGVRELMGRIFARRRVRELGALILVLAAAVPQVLLLTDWQDKLVRLPAGLRLPKNIWPWGATARIALVEGTAADFLVILFWVAVAFAFGRWQFETGLRFDAEAARATATKSETRSGFLDRVYRFPGVLLRDPLAALVEKELRFLSRAPRFRLV